MNPAEAYILKQEAPYRAILMHLQAVIVCTLPTAELQYKWGLPCYYIGKRPICYINKSKDYVDLGFWHAAYLSEKFNDVLISEKRKVVKSLRYKSLEAVNDKVLIEILKEVFEHKDKSFYKKL
ncbi:DUF1801 domain-containing protein [Bizionia sp. KMM 8389]